MRAPWPISTVAVSNDALPSACSLTIALDTDGASGALIVQAMPLPLRGAERSFQPMAAAALRRPPA